MGVLKVETIFLSACRYDKGPWSECVDGRMARNDKLKQGSDGTCVKDRQISKKCKPTKGAKSTKGKTTQ